MAAPIADRITNEEKWELFLTLYKKGTNIDSLKEVFPLWPEEKMRLAINHYKYKADKARKNLIEKSRDHRHLANLEKWKKYLEDCHLMKGTCSMMRTRSARITTPFKGNRSELLSKVMLYAACYENHYQSDDIDEPNYSEIYRYLSQILAGDDPTQLRPGSAKKIIEMYNNLMIILADKEYDSYREAILMSTPTYIEDEEDESNLREDLEDINLFEEMEDYSDLKLKQDDPYYDVKKEKLLKKLKQDNIQTVNKISKIPGFYPLKVPANFMLNNRFTLNTKLLQGQDCFEYTQDLKENIKIDENDAMIVTNDPNMVVMGTSDGHLTNLAHTSQIMEAPGTSQSMEVSFDAY